MSNCNQDLIWSGLIFFVVKYKYFCLVSALSDAFLTLLISFFLIEHKVLDVTNVCCYCCLILLFVTLMTLLALLIMANLINLIRYFLLRIFVGGDHFFKHLFLWKVLEFLGVFYLFFIWLTFDERYRKYRWLKYWCGWNIDERDRNFMCQRTLLSTEPPCTVQINLKMIVW